MGVPTALGGITRFQAFARMLAKSHFGAAQELVHDEKSDGAPRPQHER
jgi:hypothetical protein